MKIEYKPLVLVLLTLFFGLASAAILDSLADRDGMGLQLLIVGLLLVLLVNAGRLVLWSFIHKRFPLSKTYPLTALFFPLILLLALFKGDSVSINQVIGVLIITVGVFQLARIEEVIE